jgi:hypothetical protein
VLEADKVARNFTASVASVYKLSISKVTLPDINNNLPGLDRLLKHKRKGVFILSLSKIQTGDAVRLERKMFIRETQDRSCSYYAAL